MLEFTPLTDEEMQSYRKELKPGVGNFHVLEATEQLSNGGYPMIKLKLQVWDSEGTEGTVLDWILTTMPKMAWKLKHFCSAIGHSEIYESGKISVETLPSKCGAVKLILKKDNKNIERIGVADYLDRLAARTGAIPTRQDTTSSPADDWGLDMDDIPL